MAHVFYPSGTVTYIRNVSGSTLLEYHLSTADSGFVIYLTGSSWATSSLTASYAISASYALNASPSLLITGSTYPITSSWALSSSYFNQKWLETGSVYPITSSEAISSSYALSASYAPTITGSELETGSTYPFTSSFSITSSVSNLPWISNGNNIYSSLSSSNNVNGIDSATVLMLHMNGNSGSSAFIDSSWYPKTITAFAGVSMSVDTKKFGTSSGYFNTANSYLQTTESSDWQLGTDWTIDFWMYPTSYRASFTMFYSWIPTTGWIQCYLNGSGQIAITTNSQVVTYTGSIVPIGSWSHIALASSASICRAFITGTLIGQNTVTVPAGDATHAVTIGWDGTANRYFSGYMDEYRVSKGVARWTASFTPPTQEYSGSLTIGGNVGIGVAVPVNKLDVFGNIYCSVITASLFYGTASVATSASVARSASVATSASYSVSSSYSLTASGVKTSGQHNYFVEWINGGLSLTSSMQDSNNSISIRDRDIYIYNNSGSLLQIQTWGPDANDYSYVDLFRARGNANSESPAQSGDTIGVLGFRGYGNNLYWPVAYVRVVAEENFSDSSTAASMRFATTNVGESAQVERWRITPSGSLMASGSQIIHSSGSSIRLIGTASYALTASAMSVANYTTLSTGSNNWITASFLNSENYVNITTGASYTFTCSNVPTSPQILATSVFIYNTAADTSSLSFPSDWIFIGSVPTSITESKSAVLSLKAYGNTIVAGFGVQY